MARERRRYLRRKEDSNLWAASVSWWIAGINEAGGECGEVDAVDVLVVIEVVPFPTFLHNHPKPTVTATGVRKKPSGCPKNRGISACS